MLKVGDIVRFADLVEWEENKRKGLVMHGRSLQKFFLERFEGKEFKVKRVYKFGWIEIEGIDDIFYDEGYFIKVRDRRRRMRLRDYLRML